MSVKGVVGTCWVASNRPGKHSAALAELVVSVLLYKTNTENVLEVTGKNRSVMPFDVLGCTRATMTMSASIIFMACAKALANLVKHCRNMDC